MVDDEEHLRARDAARREVVKALLWATTHGQDLVGIVSAAPTRRDAVEALTRPPHHWTESQAHHILDATLGRLSAAGVAALQEELEQLDRGGGTPRRP